MQRGKQFDICDKTPIFISAFIDIDAYRPILIPMSNVVIELGDQRTAGRKTVWPPQALLTFHLIYAELCRTRTLNMSLPDSTPCQVRKVPEWVASQD